MKTNVQRSLGIILAIAAKDMVDAIKNKSILSQVITVAFIIVFYRFLPALEGGDALPRLALYDANQSQLVVAMEESLDFDLVLTTSRAALKGYVEDRDSVVLGLALPTDFDQKVKEDEGVRLEGYVVHWTSESEVAEIQSFFEESLSGLAGTSIQIHVDGNEVYTRPDSRGLAFLVSLSAVLAMVIAGSFIVPLLMLEEKQNKTMDALLVSPASPGLVVLGKALSGSIYCLLLAGAVLALNHAFVTQWSLALVATLVGVLFCVSLGLLLGSIFEVKQQLTIWGFVALNGLAIPMFLTLMDDLLPAGVMTVIHAIPTVALTKLFRVSFSNNASILVYGPELAVVLVSIALVLGAVLWIVRRSDR